MPRILDYNAVADAGSQITIAEEALAPWHRFVELEDGGAFAVECELIPANVMAVINQRTGMATISLGSAHFRRTMRSWSLMPTKRRALLGAWTKDGDPLNARGFP